MSDQFYEMREFPTGFKELYRLDHVRMGASGLTEYGKRFEMPFRAAPRAPGTCATYIYSAEMRPGTVYELKSILGTGLYTGYGVVTADGQSIAEIEHHEAMDILDPPGSIRRKFNLSLLHGQRRVRTRHQRYVLDDTGCIPVDETFHFHDVLCVCDRKTARQAWIRPRWLGEVHPGVPFKPGPPPENQADHLPARLLDGSGFEHLLRTAASSESLVAC